MPVTIRYRVPRCPRSANPGEIIVVPAASFVTVPCFPACFVILDCVSPLCQSFIGGNPGCPGPRVCPSPDLLFFPGGIRSHFEPRATLSPHLARRINSNHVFMRTGVRVFVYSRNFPVCFPFRYRWSFSFSAHLHPDSLPWL